LVGLLVAAPLLIASAWPDSAPAHPLGNFTINHLSQVRIDQRAVEVHYILDQAEIPTFEEIQRFDRNGDGAISGSEQPPLLAHQAAEIAPNLERLAAGHAIPLGAPRDPSLTFPAGQGGLSLTRVEASFAATLPARTGSVELHDSTYDGRVGWKAIQVLPGER